MNPNREELERAIRNNIENGNDLLLDEDKPLILSALRAELSRQENAPLLNSPYTEGAANSAAEVEK